MTIYNNSAARPFSCRVSHPIDLLRHLMSCLRLLLELGGATPCSSPGVKVVVMRKFTLFRHLVIYRVSRVGLLAFLR
jgi:hypothetical protein